MIPKAKLLPQLQNWNAGDRWTSFRLWLLRAVSFPLWLATCGSVIWHPLIISGSVVLFDSITVGNHKGLWWPFHSAQWTKGKESHCQLPGILSFIPTFPAIMNVSKHRNIVLCLFLSFLSSREHIKVSVLFCCLVDANIQCWSTKGRGDTLWFPR